MNRPTTKESSVKRCIAAVVLALVGFPSAAFAMPDDLRAPDQRVQSSSLGVPPNLQAPDQRTDYAVPRHLDATGTDVAAPDQQASTGAVAPASASAPDAFDWAEAGPGAAGAASLLGISLAGGFALRRRQHRRVSALAG
jgi:hypothetical protein